MEIKCKGCDRSKVLTGFYLRPNGGLMSRYCKKCYQDKYSPNRGKPNTGRFKKGLVPWNRKEVDGRQGKRLREWRKLVKERDGCVCQECNYLGDGRLMHSHHISGWYECPKLRFDVDNGITLCQSCHAKIHGREKCNFLNDGVSWIKGKTMSAEHCKKLSNAHKGKKLSIEHRKSLSIAQIKRYQGDLA